MLDVWGVAANALWVCGAALLLATLSEAYMLARCARCSVRHVLETGGYRMATDLGLTLFCAGMAATEARTWVRWLWLVLTGVFVVELIGRWRQARRPKAPPLTEEEGA